MNRTTLKLKPRAAAPETPKGVWFTQSDLADMQGCWKKATGTLVYDPKRHNFRKDHKAHTLILEMNLGDADLYYQSFLEKKFGSWYKLQRPMWGLHITVVRGDEYNRVAKDWWGKVCPDQEITIEYNPTELRKRWQFWSIPVRSDFLQKVRKDLGLKPFHDFHLTVAREYDWQIGVL